MSKIGMIACFIASHNKKYDSNWMNITLFIKLKTKKICLLIQMQQKNWRNT